MDMAWSRDRDGMDEVSMMGGRHDGVAIGHMSGADMWCMVCGCVDGRMGGWVSGWRGCVEELTLW